MIFRPDLLAPQIDQALHALPDQSAAALRQERRRWSASLRNCPAESVLALGLLLFERFSHRWIAYELLLFYPAAFALVGPDNVERLAGSLRSWGDVDQFGVLLAGPAWRAGQLQDHSIHEWARRPDRFWRRAALVATVPLNTRARGGTGDVRRTLEICEILIKDRDDLVVKAMSWSLRELITHDRPAVETFLAEHDVELAARVKREVRSKLTTGLKHPPPHDRTEPP